MFKPGGQFACEFVTSNHSTGAAVDADSLPAATANRNGVDDGAFTLTVAKIDTGRYKVTGTIPSGYAAGDVLNISFAATISSVATKQVVGPITIDKDTTIDMTQSVPSSNTAQTLGDALNAARAQGFGKWVLSGTLLTLYAADNTTVVRSFTLDNPTNPTQRI